MLEGVGCILLHWEYPINYENALTACTNNDATVFEFTDIQQQESAVLTYLQQKQTGTIKYHF